MLIFSLKAFYIYLFLKPITLYNIIFSKIERERREMIKKEDFSKCYTK